MENEAENLLASFVSLSDLCPDSKALEGCAGRISSILSDGVSATDIASWTVAYWNVHRTLVQDRKSVACDSLIFRFAFDAFIHLVVANNQSARKKELRPSIIPARTMERIKLN